MSLTDKKKFPSNPEKRRKIKEIKNNELNKQCFDCGSCFPEYISINNGVFLCKDCLKVHNKFPKEISTTLKNNLSSLNLKELEFMYLGGNQKLLEFINYEYPQLHKFKLNILYQTKAMQYYRNNLYYLVYGGPKPIKPNEKINAYEFVDSNDFASKNEKINIRTNNKINIVKTSNTNKRENKRTKSVERSKLKLPEKRTDKREKNKTYKVDKDKRRNSLLHTDNDDSLKKHKSFYKEMSKLFGDNYDTENQKIENNKKDYNDNNTYKNQKTKNENDRKKKDSKDNKENYKFIPNTNENNKNSNFKEYPIGHIYNNNYFTLSATKNIFMFTPNKDSIIYKHRKINTVGNQNNNPALKAVKEVYYKPKIPYLININKKKIEDEKLFFSLQENYNNNNIEVDNNNDLHQLSNAKSLNIFSTINNKNNSTNKNNTTDEPLNNKKITKDDNGVIFNGGKNIEKDDNDEKKFNETFTNKITYKKKNNKLNDNNNIISNEKKDNNNFIIYRNNNKDNELNINYNNKKNKTELKGIKTEKIIKSITDNIHNEINSNMEDIKNKTFFNTKDSKLRINNMNFYNKGNDKDKDKENKDNITISKTENNKKNPIKIEEGNDDDEIATNNLNIKKKINIKEEINDNDKIAMDKRKKITIQISKPKDKEKEKEKENEKEKEIHKDINKEIKNINKDKEEKKIKEKNKGQIIIKEKEDNKNADIIINEGNDSYFSKERNKNTKRTFPMGRFGLKREFNKIISDNCKDIQIKSIPNSETSSVVGDNINNIEPPQKFSIRNKYKMKKLNEKKLNS